VDKDPKPPDGRAPSDYRDIARAADRFDSVKQVNAIWPELQPFGAKRYGNRAILSGCVQFRISIDQAPVTESEIV